MQLEALVRTEKDGPPVVQSNPRSNYASNVKESHHQVDLNSNVDDRITAATNLANHEKNQQISISKKGQDTTELGDSYTRMLADAKRTNTEHSDRSDVRQADQDHQLAATGEVTSASASPKPDRSPFRSELVWTNIILFALFHMSIPIGLYMLYTQRPWKTLIFSILASYAAFLGVTGGSHRLWSHRAYKAKWPVQVLLCILQTMAGQNSIYTWARDHRVHHKYEETDADPHNINRGFFFAHMGWLCCRKHPDVIEKGKSIDMSDLKANPYVMFQYRHFWWMALVFLVILPTMVPILLWGERFWTSLVFAFMIRYLLSLHSTWLVNSVAHYYGNRPYDDRIEARNSLLAIWLALGEGFHNYHHTFPYDYAASEFGRHMNLTTAFIDLCAALGLVYGRRKVDPKSIIRRRTRTGNLRVMTGKLENINDETTANISVSQLRHRCCKATGEQEGEQVVGPSLAAGAGGQRDQVGGTDELDGAMMMIASLNNIIHELRPVSCLECTPVC